MTLSRDSEKWLMLSTVGPRYLHGLHRISRVILPFHAQMWYEIQQVATPASCLAMHTRTSSKVRFACQQDPTRFLCMVKFVKFCTLNQGMP